MITKPHTQLPFIDLDNVADTLEPQKKTYRNSFLKWPGSKLKLLDEIYSRFPEKYSKYFEPFCGASVVTLNLPDKHNHAVSISDLNLHLIECLQLVRDDVQSIVDELYDEFYSYDKDRYYEIRTWGSLPVCPQLPLVKRVARIIYLNKTCYNGLFRLNASGEFNVPIGRYSDPCILDIPSLRACSERLQGVDIKCRSYQDVPIEEGALYYFDPPYIPISDSSSFTKYNKNDFTIYDQTILADFCEMIDKEGAYFILSNSDCKLSRYIYKTKGFNTETVYTHRSIGNKESRGKIPEIIVKNF